MPMPESLRDLLDDTEAEGDPVQALRSSRGVFKEFSGWQAQIVAEAIESGATWEDVGEALGTTRQAAWGRFRTTVEGGIARPTPHREEVKHLNQQVKQQMRSFQLKLKDFDQKWRNAQRDLKEQLRNLERTHREERKKLQQEFASVEASLREQVRTLSEPEVS